MRFWRVLAGCRARRRAREEDLERELRTHLDLEVEEQQEAGVPPDEARCAALRAFGNMTLVKEEVREIWGWTWLEQLWQDSRYGFRTLRKNPGFTAVAVLSLALGIGGSAAMFSLVNGVLIRPLPYSQPDRLVRVTDYYPKGAVVALQQLSRTMDVAAYTTDSEFNLTGQGEALRVVGSSTSANLFSLLGARAERGSTFQPGEDQPGQDRIVILSHALWKNKFGGDPTMIGRVITIDGLDREAVGVMPPDFSFPSSGVQLWIPLHLDPTNMADFWGFGYMPLIGRLRAGATLQQAQDEIRPLISHIITTFPFSMARNWNADAAVIPLQQDMVSNMRNKLLVLLGAVGIVLLIACVNAASLLLSRGAARRKEIALRAALGAARGRLVRQLLTESTVLALAGAGLGAALASGALSVLKLALLTDAPRLVEVGLDWQALTFMALLAVLTGLAAGIAPAITASRFDLAESIKSGGQRSAGIAGIRLRSSFITGEVALAAVLAIGAGLLIKTLWRMTQVNPGFRPEHILTVRVSPNRAFCEERSACIALYDELRRRARALSGISDVAAANALPLSGEIPAIPVEVEGHPLRPAENLAPMLWAGAITPEYFRIMRIPLLTGRAFTDADGEKSAQVVVVSAATARHFWPGEDPIGKHIRVVWDQQWRSVVGVVGDVRQFDLANNSPGGISGAFYMPYPQAVGLNRQLPVAMNLLVGTAAEPFAITDEVRRLVTDLNPNVPVSDVRTMEAIVTGSTSQPRSMMWLFVSFAGTALILAAIGTYGVVSYSTAQRTFEMGLRVALGATKSNVFGLVLGQSLRLVLIGLGLGVVAALALTRMLSSFLYGVTATDPNTYLAVGILLVAIALLAGYVPARRAASVDPVTALRVE
jgi:putative ABC transport system permease protein